MTSHGFAKPIVKSSKTSTEEIAEIARQISLVGKPIIRSHVVQHIVCGEAVGSEIIFEFSHLRKHEMTPADLLKRLQKIHVGEHQIANATDFWIIQNTYQDGESIDSHLQEE